MTFLRAPQYIDSSIQKVATEKMGTPCLPEVPWERRRVMGTSCSQEDSDWTPEENFTQREQSAIGIISQGSSGFPRSGHF